MRNIDPINLEIYWARVIAIANEMMETLIRTSFSTVIRVNRDCSAAIFDHTGRMLAQPSHSAPGHVGCMPGVVRRILERFPAGSIRPGDAFVTNDPWIGAGHSPDIYIASPVFRRERLAGFACTVAHHIDIGGRVGPTDSQDVFEEGLLIPPMRLYSAGERNEILFQVMEANVRLPHIVLGDFDAQMASNRLGAERLIEFAEDYDLDDFGAVAQAITDATERAMRAAIRALPDGRFEVVQNLELRDENNETVTVRLSAEIAGDGMIFDYAGSSPQIRRPINCVMNYTMSYTVLGLKMLLAPELPYNEGTQLPVTVRAPDASILNARRPAAVWRRAVLGMQLPEIVFRVLAPVVPDRIIAGCGSSPMWLWLLSGWRPDGKRFVFQTHFMGGMGAGQGHDGLSTAAFPYNMTDSPVEIFENGCPVIVHRRELIRDSGGHGKFRGGLGQEIIMSPAPPKLGRIEGALTASFSTGHLHAGPAGAQGGHAGARAEVALNNEPVTNPLVTLRMNAGDRLTIRLPGGGGFDAPLDRAPEAVRGDVLAGFVSPEAAKSVYGVVLTGPGSAVDTAATTALRERMRDN
ncbi:MAG: hydantoinase B/oxoprolinase family protein [Burkholderiales bacterium]|nr:hydantoinase B/oxoprolinase family protein [Burkholderiales bacterium]